MGGTTGAGGGVGGAGAVGNGGRGGSSGGAAGTGGGRGGSSAGGSAGSAGAGGAGAAMNVCTATASGTPANTLTVNADTAQYAVSSGIFGLLMERLGKNWSGGLFVGTSSSIPNTDGMRNDVIQAFKDAGVGMIEWPGGCAANGYNWSANKNPSNDVGTDRYMELCGLLGIPPIIAGPANDTTTDPASNLAWVTYINNNPSHPEWTINHFKLGNEVWGCGAPGGSNGTEAMYETFYNAGYTMLSTPVNGKKLNLVAGTDLIGRWPWLDTMLNNIGSKIDGIEIHDYIYHPSDIPNVGFSDAQYYNIVNAANKGQIGPRIDTAVMYLDKYDPNKRIKIYEDEWGDWLKPFNSASDGWLQQGTLMDAISAAESLHIFMQHADRYAMAGLAQGVNVIHSLLLTRSTDSALVKTPTFYVFKMFLPHHRSNAKWAPSTLASENITQNTGSGNQTFPVLSAGSTVDDAGRVNISLANVDLTNARTIKITVNSSRSGYVVSSAQVITGPAKDSYNDYAQTETVNIQTLAGSSCSISGKTVQVTLPAKSVAMLVLTPQ
jgi:alpha-N-arabinofuranosidase